MTVSLYPRTIALCAAVVVLGLALGGWASAAVWRIGAIAVVLFEAVHLFVRRHRAPPAP